MQITKIDGMQLDIDGQRVIASDFLSAVFATIGPEHLVEDLESALLQLSHSLHNQNFGDVGSEAYAPGSTRGNRFEDVVGELISKIQR